MKKIIIFISILTTIISSCEKEPAYTAAFTAIDSGNYAFVKFINTYSLATPVFSGQTSAAFQISLNGAQFSATPLGIGAAYPASAGYAAVPQSVENDFSVRLGLGTPPSTVRDSLLYNYKTVLQPRKHYSFFLFDSIHKPDSRIIAVQDDLRIPQVDTMIRIRFANLIPNPPAATPAIDVYSSLTNTIVFLGVPAKTITQFIEIPRPGSVSTNTVTYTLRWAGTTTTIGTVAVSQLNKGSYTIIARGYVGATGARAPGASAYRNR
ncbi:MAG: DUF4397 domain-containing protein [Chitinophagaceae bacterium]|nr:DUF4397 domain-containing protein [Chitinophagaceae bacterium]